MHRIDGPTAAAALPAPGAVIGTPGYFTGGDPLTNTPATVPGPDWANAIQEEIAAVVEHAGIQLDKTDNAQLLAAILALFGAAGVTTDVENGEFRFYGGGLCKVGTNTTATGEGSVAVVFRTPFPTACLSVTAIPINPSADHLSDFEIQLVSKSATGFTAYVEQNGDSADPIAGFSWEAKGY